MTAQIRFLLLSVALLGCDVDSTDMSGEIGQPCTDGISCEQGLVCVTGDSEFSVCALPGAVEPCEHGMAPESPGRVVDGGCVPSCYQYGDECGRDYVCAPVDAYALGFCAAT